MLKEWPRGQSREELPDMMEVVVPRLPTDDIALNSDDPDAAAAADPQTDCDLGMAIRVHSGANFFNVRTPPARGGSHDGDSHTERDDPPAVVGSDIWNDPSRLVQALCAIRPNGTVFWGPIVSPGGKKVPARK